MATLPLAITSTVLLAGSVKRKRKELLFPLREWPRSCFHGICSYLTGHNLVPRPYLDAKEDGETGLQLGGHVLYLNLKGHLLKQEQKNGYWGNLFTLPCLV